MLKLAAVNLTRGARQGSDECFLAALELLRVAGGGIVVCGLAGKPAREREPVACGEPACCVVLEGLLGEHVEDRPHEFGVFIHHSQLESGPHEAIEVGSSTSVDAGCHTQRSTEQLRVLAVGLGGLNECGFRGTFLDRHRQQLIDSGAQVAFGENPDGRIDRHGCTRAVFQHHIHVGVSPEGVLHDPRGLDRLRRQAGTVHETVTLGDIAGGDRLAVPRETPIEMHGCRMGWGPRLRLRRRLRLGRLRLRR